MPSKITNLNVDLLQNRAQISLSGEGNNHVSISVPIETPGNQPENRLQEIAKAAAAQALRDALAALEES